MTAPVIVTIKDGRICDVTRDGGLTLPVVVYEETALYPPLVSWFDRATTSPPNSGRAEHAATACVMARNFDAGDAIARLLGSIPEWHADTIEKVADVLRQFGHAVDCPTCGTFRPVGSPCHDWTEQITWWESEMSAQPDWPAVLDAAEDDFDLLYDAVVAHIEQVQGQTITELADEHLTVQLRAWLGAASAARWPENQTVLDVLRDELRATYLL